MITGINDNSYQCFFAVDCTDSTRKLTKNDTDSTRKVTKNDKKKIKTYLFIRRNTY